MYPLVGRLFTVVRHFLSARARCLITHLLWTARLLPVMGCQLEQDGGGGGEMVPPLGLELTPHLAGSVSVR